MQVRIKISHVSISIWLLLALLAHLLLFITFSIQLKNSYPEVAEEEDKVLPAYMYHEDSPPRATPTSMPETSENMPPPEPPADAGSEITTPEKVESATDGTLPAKKPVDTTMVQHEGQTKSFHYKVAQGSINVKAEKQVDIPLLRILSIATAAKLFYPKIAADFQVTGTVKIRFLITPDGTVSDISIADSSGAGVLDKGALETIQAISPVKGVASYLKEPQYLTVALIYD
jgi:TonB family protein